MKKAKWFFLVVNICLLAAMLAGCATPATPVTQMVEVTKIVAGTPVVEQVVITATPEPTINPYDNTAPITVWVDTTRKAAIDLYIKAHPESEKLINVSVGNTNPDQKVLLFNNTGQGWPDVLFWEPHNVQILADAAHYFPLDMTPWLEAKNVLSGFPKAAMDPCIIEGKIFCLRNDLAQDVLYYNKPLMEEFGYTVPTTWEEFQDLSDRLAQEHPGYVMGGVNSSWDLFPYTQGSNCPLAEVLGISQTRINPTDPKCERALKLVDHMLANGTLARLDAFDPAYIKLVNDNKLLMVNAASWFGEYIFGGKPDSLYYKTAEGQLGVALPLKWKDEDKAYTGAWGGSSWIVSRHTKNPELAVDLVVWLATDTSPEGYQSTAPTYPAYGPAAEVWAKTVQGNKLYANDPIPVFKAAADMISTTENLPRYDVPGTLDKWIKEINQNSGMLSDPVNVQKLVDTLVPLAEAQGYLVELK